MPLKNIITHQKIDPSKLARAKELRQQMTEEESAVWNRLRKSQTGFHFRRQQIIAGFIVDFYCHSTNMVVEIDGGIHQQQLEYDQERDQVLRAMGLQVLHIKNELVHQNLDLVIQNIIQVCNLSKGDAIVE